MRFSSHSNCGPMRAWNSCSSPTGATPVPEDPEQAWPAVAHNWLRITPLHKAARGDLEKAKALLYNGCT
jgi:hypothetical protein